MFSKGYVYVTHLNKNVSVNLCTYSEMWNIYENTTKRHRAVVECVLLIMFTCIAFQGKLDSINIDTAVAYIVSCMNFDGGFGCTPGSETHAGQVSLF